MHASTNDARGSLQQWPAGKVWPNFQLGFGQLTLRASWPNPSWKLTAKLCLADVRLHDDDARGLCGARTLTCLLGLTREDSGTQPINSLCDARKHWWHTPFSPTVTCRQSLAFNFQLRFDQLAVTWTCGAQTLTYKKFVTISKGGFSEVLTRTDP